jgi:enterochelin esterase-like enzyme
MENPPSVRNDFEFHTSIPQSYKQPNDKTGTIVKLSYPCYHYTDLTDMGVKIQPIFDGKGYHLERRAEPITKSCNVYLPYNYSSEQEYRVVYILHGITDNEDAYLRSDDIRILLDNLISFETVEPFIAVFPNGNSSSSFMDRRFENQAGYYFFGNELIYDLLPLIESKYSVKRNRDSRSICGFSMGGMQTINIGLCQSLEYFSWFGALAAAPTTYPSSQIAVYLDQQNQNEVHKIHYLYALCGNDDFVALPSHTAAMQGLAQKTKYLTAENFFYQIVPGGHDGFVANLGIYNFLRLNFGK